MTEKKKSELSKEEIEAKQKALLKQIRTAPIFEVAHKIKDCSADGGKRCDESRFTVFLGAGTSFQAGIKTAGQMMAEFREKILKRDCPEILDEKKQEQWLKKNVFNKSHGNEYSKLFEAFERTQKGRQNYISKLIKNKKPTFGYAMLASLIARGFINTVLTTNFDDLMFIACNKFTGVRPVIYAYGIMATEMKFSAPHTKILKMHGDYLYSTLANTEKEMSLFNQDPNMKSQFTHALNEFELIVFGYSGSDDSVMKILENYPGGKEFYWCHWSREIPNLRVLELLKAKDGTLVSIEGFDDAMYEIYKIVDFDLDEVLASYEERRSEILRFIDEFEHKYSTPIIIKEAIEESKIPKIKIEREPETWWECYDVAFNAVKNRNNEMAKKYFNKVIALNSTISDAYNWLGVLYMQDKTQWNLAEKFYRQAIEHNPNHPFAYNNLGLLFYNQNKTDDAIDFVKKSLDIDRSYVSSYASLAALYKKKNEFIKSKKYIEKGLSIVKDNDFYDLACLHAISENKEETFHYLQLAIEENPIRKTLPKTDPDFDWIRDDERFREIVGKD